MTKKTKSDQITDSKIIGGVFALDWDLTVLTANTPCLSFMKNTKLLLANARSCFFSIIELLSPKFVWLPSYICAALLEPIHAAQIDYGFYEIDEKLKIKTLCWVEAIKPQDLVVIIDYFGFPVNHQVIEQAKSNGAWIVQDKSQALLTDVIHPQTDFVIYSPRKFIPIPDGGILVAKNELDFSTLNLSSAPGEWWLKSFYTLIYRRDFDFGASDSRTWFELFQASEINMPMGFYSMSSFSLSLLEHGFNYSTIKNRRRENYQYLAKDLKNIALYPSLPDAVVPLGFPIKLANRDQVRTRLFEAEIYPPIHWPLENVVPLDFKESHALSQQIMTLPVDQRYDQADMDRILKIVVENF